MSRLMPWSTRIFIASPFCSRIPVYKAGPLAVDESAGIAQPPGRRGRIMDVRREAEWHAGGLAEPQQATGGHPLAPARGAAHEASPPPIQAPVGGGGDPRHCRRGAPHVAPAVGGQDIQTS